jgi:hypothetical protein
VSTIDWNSPVTTAQDLAARVERVAQSLQDRTKTPGVSVELLTDDPYTNTLAQVTAVGFKHGDVLLTIKPRPEHGEHEMVLALAKLIREVDGNHDLGAARLAQALVSKGVLATSVWR